VLGYLAAVSAQAVWHFCSLPFTLIFTVRKSKPSIAMTRFFLTFRLLQCSLRGDLDIMMHRAHGKFGFFMHDLLHREQPHHCLLFLATSKMQDTNNEHHIHFLCAIDFSSLTLVHALRFTRYFATPTNPFRGPGTVAQVFRGASPPRSLPLFDRLPSPRALHLLRSHNPCFLPHAVVSAHHPGDPCHRIAGKFTSHYLPSLA
jgi:hypothetical protein